MNRAIVYEAENEHARIRFIIWISLNYLAFPDHFENLLIGYFPFEHPPDSVKAKLNPPKLQVKAPASGLQFLSKVF